MSGVEDTETLLALISSLLDNPVHDQAVLLDALVECDGDIERSAQLLNSRSSLSPSSSSRGDLPKAQVNGQKRKAAGLEGWLQKPEVSFSNRHESKKTKHARYNDTPLKQSKKVQPMASSSKTAPPDSTPRSRKLPPSTGPDEDVLPTLPADDEDISSNHNFSNSNRAVPQAAISPVKVKNVTNAEFMSILRPPNSSDNIGRHAPPKHPPLTLSTPEMIAKHVPCTMHTSVLPPELACRLFYTMLDLSQDWSRNKWWLFDRLVESPHKTSFFIRRYPSSSETEGAEMDEAAQFWYNGRQTGPSPPFPKAMEEACQYIENIVNAELLKRERFPLEWGGDAPHSEENSSSDDARKIIWRANVAASNCYEGTKEGVGFHSDALTYLGPYPTIASLSLGTTRTFRLREVVPANEKDDRAARTYNIPLPHNSLTIMHASCQEMFKHAIPPQRTLDLFHPQHPPPQELRDRMTSESYNQRINITFRFFRPDFKPSSIPKCKCGVPCILRPDMKNRYTLPLQAAEGEKSGRPLRREAVAKYWWTCHSGAQNEGKGCGMWQVMDAQAEGRGPFVGDVS